MSFLDGSLATEIGAAMASIFLPATLVRTSRAAGSNPWESGAETTTSYTCRAIHDEWGAGYLAQGLVKAGEVKLLILASSLTVEPIPGDVVTITGRGSWTIAPEGDGGRAVQTDPARAVWTCRAKS